MSHTPKYLGHVNIFVRNAARSRQWYADASYELPRSQWPLHEEIFSGAARPRGLFPGPWDEHRVESQLLAR